MQPTHLISYEVNAEFQLKIQAVMQDPFQHVYNCHNNREVNHHIIVESFEVLWYHLEKYILHSEIIIISNRNYTAPLVSSGLEKCKNFLKWIPDHKQDIWALCDNILKMHTYLHAILPYPGNKSYESSLLKLESILLTARFLKDELSKIHVPA